MLANFVLYGIGFLLIDRLTYGWTPLAITMALCFLVMAVAMRLWSRKWWMVVLPAAAGYLWGLGGSKWAIHFTDTRGEYAPPISQYVLHPSAMELTAAVVAAVAAGLGWWLMSRLLTVRGIATPHTRVPPSPPSHAAS